MTVKLFQFPAAWGVANPSPFCMKVETFLRMAEIPFEIVVWEDPRKAPKGKLPMIEHEGRRIADSSFILRYLTERFSVTLDQDLTEDQKVSGFMLTKMLDEYFYWMMVHNRWMDDRVWLTIRDGFFGSMPTPMRQIISAMLRAKVRRNLSGQGMGRHSQAEINELADESLQILAKSLGEKPFIMGAAPTSFDATFYSYIANAALVPFDTEFQHLARVHDNLMSYCERMKARFYPA